MPDLTLHVWGNIAWFSSHCTPELTCCQDIVPTWWLRWQWHAVKAHVTQPHSLALMDRSIDQSIHQFINGSINWSIVWLMGWCGSKGSATGQLSMQTNTQRNQAWKQCCSVEKETENRLAFPNTASLSPSLFCIVEIDIWGPMQWAHLRAVDIEEECQGDSNK